MKTGQPKLSGLWDAGHPFDRFNQNPSGHIRYRLRCRFPQPPGPIHNTGQRSSELNDTQYRILSEIRNNPNVTKQQLARILSKGKTTIDNGIAVLREKRYIVRMGSNKTGYWKVQDPDE